MKIDKMQLAENQRIERSHKEWEDLLRKELRINDLESRVVHIDYDVIYNPFAKRIAHDDITQISDFQPLSIGVSLGNMSAKDGNAVLRQLLKFDLRSIRLRGDEIEDWNSLFEGIFLEMITVIIDFESQKSRESFDAFKSNHSESESWSIVTNRPEDNETKLLDYTPYNGLKNSERLRCILFDVDKAPHSKILVQLNLSEKLVANHTVHKSHKSISEGKTSG